MPEKFKEFYDIQMALYYISKHAFETKNAKRNLTINGRLEVMYNLHERIIILKQEIED